MMVIFWWAITAIAMGGAWLNARGRWQGFVLWLVTNTAMGIKALSAGDYAQAALWAMYDVICVVGLWSWRGEVDE